LREKPKLNLGLTAYDDLFKDEQELAEGKLPKIYDIPIELIDEFPDHPFKVRMDEDMDQLVKSVKERGFCRIRSDQVFILNDYGCFLCGILRIIGYKGPLYLYDSFRLYCNDC